MPSSGEKAGVAARLMTGILDLLFPPRCAFCGKLLDEPGEVCAGCRGSLPFREEADTVQRIGENGYRCAVTFYYDGPVREGIRALKFGKKSWRARVFGRYAARTAAERLGGEFDAVTFVPVSRKRNFERGFDQARLLAPGRSRCWKRRGIRGPSPPCMTGRPGRKMYKAHMRSPIRNGCGAADFCCLTMSAPPAAPCPPPRTRFSRRAPRALSAPPWRAAAGRRRMERNRWVNLVNFKKESPGNGLQKLVGLCIMSPLWWQWTRIPASC